MKEPKVIQKMGGILLCLLLIPLILYLNVAGMLQYYLSAPGIRSIVESNPEYDENLNDFIAEAFYLDEASAYLTDEDMQQCRDLYENAVVHMVHYSLTGEGEIVDVAAFMDFVKGHRKVLEEAFGYELEAEDIRYLKEDLEYLNEDYKEYYADILSDYDEPVASAAAYLDTFLGKKTMVAAGACIAVGIFLLFVLLHKRKDKALVYAAVTVIVSSVLLLTGYGFIELLAGRSDMGDGLFDFYLDEAWIPAAYKIAARGFWIAGIQLFTGVLVNILGHIMRRSNKKRLADAA